jgi:hypothetical protein
MKKAKFKNRHINVTPKNNKTNLKQYSHMPVSLKLGSQFICTGLYSTWGAGVWKQKRMKPP